MFNPKKELLVLLIVTFAGCKHEPLDLRVPSFEKTFGGISEDLGEDLILTDDAVFLLGTTSTNQGQKALVLKLDHNGNKLWERTYGSGEFKANGLDTDDYGNLYISGRNDDRLTLIATDRNGTVLWESSLADSVYSEGSAALPTENGTYVIGTRTDSDRQLLLTKFDFVGTPEWSKTYGGLQNEGGSDIIATPNGNLFAYGYTESFGSGNRDHWVLQFNSDGDSINSVTLGGANYEESQGIAATQNGLVLCGHSASSDPSHDLHVLKLNQNLIGVQFDQHLGIEGSHEGGEGVAVTYNGEILTVGRSNGNSTNGEDIYMCRLNASGTLISDTLIGGTLSDRGNAIACTSTHAFIVGSTNSYGNGDDDIFLVKLPL